MSPKPKMMEPWHGQLMIERDELGAKIEKLAAFLADEAKVGELTRTDGSLLELQLSAMRSYLDILDRRLLRANRNS